MPIQFVLLPLFVEVLLTFVFRERRRGKEGGRETGREQYA